ncbi:cytochrome c-type biogenesis protein [Enterovirga aerilata]|uniref:Cytochrome c-type biogenesis protein n=1 Tax=Enterovirga aerilata TaxID=2730920 RepID=A0A849HZX0_9HYPH|nr:cytochrome c-type biogenesis protein [Enterovirga sp. DB1703]NNM72632.1 cytochrome c-type biogenesis protein CcmH [Enterovirga sp. DB1703]
MIRAPLVFAAALAVAAAASGPVSAVAPDEILPDRQLESRAREISAELRCLVCQNQSIDDSDAPLARDLRVLVRDRLKAGDSDEQVRAFVVQRYGEFVLLRPVMAWHTAILWAGPALVLALAVLGVVRARRRKPATSDAPLTPDEEERIRAIGGP